MTEPWRIVTALMIGAGVLLGLVVTVHEQQIQPGANETAECQSLARWRPELPAVTLYCRPIGRE